MAKKFATMIEGLVINKFEKNLSKKPKILFFQYLPNQSIYLPTQRKPEQRMLNLLISYVNPRSW